jgi:hypothetical protein
MGALMDHLRSWLVALAASLALCALAWCGWRISTLADALQPTVAHAGAIAARLDVASAQLLECRANPACLQSQLLATTGALRDSAKQARLTSLETLATVREVHAVVVDARPQVDETLRALASAAREGALMAADARVDLARLTAGASGDLERLDAALAAVTNLAAELQRQIAAGGPEIAAVAGRLDAALGHLDELLADPNIGKTIAHAEGSAESVDIALRPLREKAHLVKVVFEKLIGLIKLTIPVR